MLYQKEKLGKLKEANKTHNLCYLRKGKIMGDYFATENWLDTQEKIDWYFREKSVLEKLKNLVIEETADQHFDKTNKSVKDLHK
jgi:hypothetical protein